MLIVSSDKSPANVQLPFLETSQYNARCYVGLSIELFILWCTIYINYTFRGQSSTATEWLIWRLIIAQRSINYTRGEGRRTKDKQRPHEIETKEKPPDRKQTREAISCSRRVRGIRGLSIVGRVAFVGSFTRSSGETEICFQIHTWLPGSTWI